MRIGSDPRHRGPIQEKDRLLADYEERVIGMDGQFHQEMREMGMALARAEERNQKLTTRFCASNLEHNKLIEKLVCKNEILTAANRDLRRSQRNRSQKLAAFAADNPELDRGLGFGRPHVTECSPPMSRRYVSDLAHEEIFRKLQTLIVSATSELENEH
jgi:hypothetical protein